jgi:hypothetical protein
MVCCLSVVLLAVSTPGAGPQWEGAVWRGWLSEAGVADRGAGISRGWGCFSSLGCLLLCDEVVVEVAQRHQVFDDYCLAGVPACEFVGFERYRFGAALPCALGGGPALVPIPVEHLCPESGRDVSGAAMLPRHS